MRDHYRRWRMLMYRRLALRSLGICAGHIAALSSRSHHAHD